MMKCELPVGGMWSGRVIPIWKGQNIFEYLAECDGEPDSDDAIFRFDLTQAELNYWIRQWRYTVREESWNQV